MDCINKLFECIADIGTTKEYNGYWFKVSEVLTILLCGLLCGLKSMHEICEYANSKPAKAMLLSTFNIRKIPSYAQFTRIVGIVKSEELNNGFIKWCEYLTSGNVLGKTISIDGKTIRSTEKMKKHTQALYIVSAYVTELNLTIGQKSVSSKSNEIPTVQELLKIIKVDGAVVTADALNCQKKTAEIIVENKADYLLAVKDNQKNLHSEIKLTFDFCINDKCEKSKSSVEYIKTIEKNRGRIETRHGFE